MKVYVVFTRDWAGWVWFWKAFSDKKKAEEYAKTKRGSEMSESIELEVSLNK